MSSRSLDGVLLVLDYDGTVTVEECNEIVLQRFTGDAWREPENACIEGRLSHGECFKQQFAMVQAPREELFDAMAGCAKLMTGVAQFLTWALSEGGRIAIVSVGFREPIQRVWKQCALPPVDIYASELYGSPNDGYTAVLNDVLGDCPECGTAACKGGAVRRLRNSGDSVVVFGNSVGDLCLAREADIVFARGLLGDLCEADGIAYHSLTDFTAARRLLANWLSERRRRSASEPAGSSTGELAQGGAGEPAGTSGSEPAGSDGAP